MNVTFCVLFCRRHRKASILKMEAASSSETSASTYQTRWRHIGGHHIWNPHTLKICKLVERRGEVVVPEYGTVRMYGGVEVNPTYLVRSDVGAGTCWSEYCCGVALVRARGGLIDQRADCCSAPPVSVPSRPSAWFVYPFGAQRYKCVPPSCT